MKFLIAFAAVATIAVAVPLQRNLAGSNPGFDEYGQPMVIGPISIAPVIVETSPISVGPAIVEANPIAVGPAIIDFPLPDGGVVTAVEPTPVIQPSPAVQPSPVVIGEIPSGQSPLVQIIVNVNQQEASAPVVPAPVIEEQEIYIPGPVNVVDSADAPVVEPIQVVEPVIVEPIQVVEPVIVEPIQVVEPVIVKPVEVVAPIVPIPAVVIPDTLN